MSRAGLMIVALLCAFACSKQPDRGGSSGAAPAGEAAPHVAPPSPTGGALVVDSQGADADLAATLAFLKTRPSMERPLSVTGFEAVSGLPNLSAETCGACHVEIAREWRDTVHATAWPDPQFQAEIAKSDNRWLCLNCHTPLLTQMDRWPVGLVDGDVERPRLVANARYDAELRHQSITCAACHVRDGAIAGPGLPRVEGAMAAPHPVHADPEWFRGAQLCIACHQAEAQYPGKTFVCTFQTGDEWAASPAAQAGKNCVTCHMPIESRPAAVGGPVREVRRHTWRGAGMAKLPGRYPPDDSNVFGLELAAEVERGQLVVTATNANAGHMLPTGDPERWVQVDVSFVDASGTATALEPLRFGQHWDWGVPPTKLSDNRLAPGVSHVARYPVPEGAVRAEVRSSNHRISKENAEFHGLKDYPTSVETGAVTVDL